MKPPTYPTPFNIRNITILGHKTSKLAAPTTFTCASHVYVYVLRTENLRIIALKVLLLVAHSLYCVQYTKSTH